MRQNVFLFLSKALGSRVNSCYSMLFSNLKQKKALLFVVELLAVIWVLCLLKRPILLGFIYFENVLNDLVSKKIKK